MIFKNRTNSSPTSIIQQYIYPHPICNILTRLKQYIPPSQGVNMICLLWLSQLTNYWISLLNQVAIHVYLKMTSLQLSHDELHKLCLLLVANGNSPNFQPGLDLVDGQLAKSASPVQRLHVHLASLLFQLLLRIYSLTFELLGRHSSRLVALFINLIKELLRSGAKFLGHTLQIRHRLVIREELRLSS